MPKLVFNAFELFLQIVPFVSDGQLGVFHQFDRRRQFGVCVTNADISILKRLRVANVTQIDSA